MAIQKISITDFTQLRQTSSQDSYIIIDVRSPGEYEHAHIPGAYSLPLFSNEERAIVGTTYKKKSREEAIKVGIPFFAKKQISMIEQVENWLSEKKDSEKNSPTVIVHCWRGGMRSAAVAWLLDLYGCKVLQLVGGYKGYRNWVLEQFAISYSFKVLGGYTGSGKTEILHALSMQQEAIVDLEGIAHHKGSAFGALGQTAQPSQEHFENELAEVLWQLVQKQKVSNKSQSIWIEDESQRIGTVIIPAELFKQMRASTCYFLEIPFEERLNFIVENYGKFDIKSLQEATIRIQKRLGGLETKNTLQFLEEKNIKGAFDILLKYYDRWYAKFSQATTQPKLSVERVVCEKVDASQNAAILIRSTP
jgi:tRNA 2-selenouridine synthase